MASERGETPSTHSAASEPVDLASASTPHSLARAVYARRAEYVRPHRIRVKIGTWNVAACPGTDKDLANWFIEGKGIDEHLGTLDLAHSAGVDHSHDGATGHPQDENGVRLIGGDKIGLYVLGLQEMIDLNIAKEAITRAYYVDPIPAQKWKSALEAMMPDGYRLVASEQMYGILLLMYASPEVTPTISNVSSVQIGTGLLGYVGNKGAVSTRLLLGETTRMTFVNCHLASGLDQFDRRIWDTAKILTDTKFEPITHGGVLEAKEEKIGDEDFAFWFGDLNFRLEDIPGDDIRRLLKLHTQGEYDLSKGKRDGPLEGDEGVIVMRESEDGDDEGTTRSTTPETKRSIDASSVSSVSLPDPDDFLPDPHEDPASLQSTLDSLLPHDQLRRAIRQKKAFHDGWRESPITFLPSYKYDVGSVSLFDSSEKQRAPSWCDRVLYRTRRDREEFLQKTKEEEDARKRDEDMKARGIDKAAEDDDVLFAYDPDNGGQSTPMQGEFEYDEYDEGEEIGEAEDVVTKEGFVDHIQLDIYTSHQRITSSDHKPIVTIFTLDYDAVVPELKAKVHAEVARELDRAENEGRPDITIVVDGQSAGTKPRPGPGHGGSDSVDFGDVEYLKKQACSLTIANTGGVPAVFSFVDMPSAGIEQPTSAPHWLTTSFIAADGVDGEPADLGKEVTLEPGETAAALLEVQVEDISHVQALNYGRSTLEDVLVLRVEDGRDHFIPVRGNWLPTSLGRSINELIRVPEGGIRSFEKAKGPIPYGCAVHSAAPRELFKLTEAIEALTERVLADENMLEGCEVPRDAPGWPFDEATWKLKDGLQREKMRYAAVAALDTDKSILDALPVETAAIEKLEIVAETLLLFLSSLTDGIVSLPLWARIESTLPNISTTTTDDLEDAKVAVLDILSATPNHNISFVFLTAMLAKVIADLSPLSAEPPDQRNFAARPVGVLGRRSLSFKRVVSEAEGARARRRARERRYAEVFGGVVCVKEKERDKKGDERRRGIVEIFIRRDD